MHVAKRPPERVDPDVASLYSKLLAVMVRPNSPLLHSRACRPVPLICFVHTRTRAILNSSAVVRSCSMVGSAALATFLVLVTSCPHICVLSRRFHMLQARKELREGHTTYVDVSPSKDGNPTHLNLVAFLAVAPVDQGVGVWVQVH